MGPAVVHFLMRVVVTVERHYRRSPQGICATGSESRTFFERYLGTFDEVVVLARVRKSPRTPEWGERGVESDRIKLVPLPDFHGVVSLLRVVPRLLLTMWNTAGRRDVAFVLRVPGFVSLLFSLVLLARGRPFGVEVVADPAQAYRSNAFGASVGSIVLGRVGTLALRMQCRLAVVTSYVTEVELQAKYPPGDGPTFSYSSIELPPAALSSQEEVLLRYDKEPSQLTEPKLIFVGNLDRPFKGLDVLIDGLSILQDRGMVNPRLQVIGDGVLRHEYEQFAERRGLAERVVFQGYVPPGKRVFEQIRAADVFVLPSRREGLPRAVIEAMASGLPCVTSDVSGVRELLDEEYIVPQDDPHSLARVIERLALSKDDRVRAATHNLDVARKYANDVLQPRREAFYRALVTKSER